MQPATSASKHDVASSILQEPTIPGQAATGSLPRHYAIGGRATGAGQLQGSESARSGPCLHNLLLFGETLHTVDSSAAVRQPPGSYTDAGGSFVD